MRVAIIGAGICGLYLAWKLAKKGHSVTVFEKKNRVGKEVCSGLFSERILDFIPHLSPETYISRKPDIWQKSAGFIPENKSLVENEIDFCLIRFPKRTLEIKFSKKFFVMSHYELDNLVAKLAEEAGARIILSREVTRNDLVNLSQEFDKIIGCGGPNSIVRRSLRLKEPEFRLAIQGFIKSRMSTDTNFVETWPTKNGFIWKIPRKNEIEYGIIERPKRVNLLFEDFLNRNNLNLNRIKSAIIPQGLIIPFHQKITLCGDAAGLTKPWSGGGVIWGLTAAEILLQNFPDFLKYRNRLKKFFLPKIILSRMAGRIVYFLGFKFPRLLPKNIEIESDFLL